MVKLSLDITIPNLLSTVDEEFNNFSLLSLSHLMTEHGSSGQQDEDDTDEFMCRRKNSHLEGQAVLDPLSVVTLEEIVELDRRADMRYRIPMNVMAVTNMIVSRECFTVEQTPRKQLGSSPNVGYNILKKGEKMTFTLVMTLILTGLVAIFIIQNVAAVEVSFLFWSLSLSRALLIFFIFIIGFLSGWFLNIYFHYRKTKTKVSDKSDQRSIPA
jgi:putative membrane protein